MADNTIGTFIGAFHGGTRPNRYTLTGTIPIGSEFFSTHIMATTIPESTVGIIPIPYRGRVYKFPGDRTYTEWAFTVLDDVGDNHLWEDLHQWSEQFNFHGSNVAQSRAHQGQYCSDLTVSHIDHNSPGEVSLKKIQFNYAWPVSVGPVTLDMSAANQLTSYQVTIAFTGYKVMYDAGGVSVNGSGDTGLTP